MAEFTELPDLAAGGNAIACNDEFFAGRENLLKPGEAEWKEHEYTDRGKWMDGWETRRRREPGYDWCIVRLGMPGAIHGVVVDTRWFRGNYPESCSIEACTIASPLDLGAAADWVEIVPRAALRGDSKNPFVVTDRRRFTHVRLNIFPDGGVARLRVHGEVIPDWDWLCAQGGPIDLAALENGAQVTACSDMFFGRRENLIKPGRSTSMADGWETKRRRGPGHDWALVKLGARGAVRQVEIDTSHFKGNAPGRCTLEGRDGMVEGEGESAWRPILATPLQPDTRHRFAAELRVVGPITHARLSVFPDGGVARLRLWGEPFLPAPAGLERLNAMPEAEAVAALRACCGAARWAERMAAERPFASLADLVRAADRAWFALDERDWLEAFSAHPRIGERREGGGFSEKEQARAQSAAAPVLARLAELNRAYEDKIGFVYLVCASGRSGEELLALLEERVGRGRPEELRTAVEEQAKITHLRLRALVHP